jgi:ADP-ribose pyrophosphatase YjhB (NUDIX family)
MPEAVHWRYCPLCRAELVPRVLDGAPRRSCPACGFVYWEHPWPAAAAVVADPPDPADPRCRIALVRRRYPPEAGGWCLPGGFVEPGETVEAAACREVWEETGLRVRPSAQIGTFGPCIAFIAAVADGSGPPRAGVDVLEAVWCQLSGMPELCFPTHRTALDRWQAGLAGAR